MVEEFHARSEGPQGSGSDGKGAGRTVAILGWYLVLIGLFLGSFLIAVWPAVEQARMQQQASSGAEAAGGIDLVGVDWLGLAYFTVTPETALLLLVLVFGAIGAYIHTVTSFADYAGNQKLNAAWMWWYGLRPVVGMSLALLFYVAVRGGLFASAGQASDINQFGIAALAGLTGMFSKTATDKLEEVFKTLFRTAPGQGDEKRADSLSNPIPKITVLAPASTGVRAEALTLNVRGEQFIEQSTVLIDDEPVWTEYVSQTELVATVDAAMLAAERQLSVKVKNPPPGGGTSEPVVLPVHDAAAVGSVVTTTIESP